MLFLIFLCLAMAVVPQGIVRLLPGIFEHRPRSGEPVRPSRTGMPLQAGLSTLGMVDAWTVIAVGAMMAAIVVLDAEGREGRKARPGAVDISRRRRGCNTPGRLSRK